MPAMTTWPVCSSVRTRNVGSSAISLAMPWPSFSWSALVFGSMASEITGSGNVIDSSRIGFFSSHSVSPVVTERSPTAAAMSPAKTSLISSRLLACIFSRRPMRSLLPLVALSTEVPVVSVPE